MSRIAAFRSSSERCAITSIPVRASIEPISVSRFQGCANFSEPTASATLRVSRSARSATTSQSAYASYHSSIVNSGLCLGERPSLRKSLPISYTRSSPPTISRFRYSSVATRRYIVRSSALKCVTNGRASAPP